MLHQSENILLASEFLDGNQLRLAQFEGEQSLRRNPSLNIYEPQGGNDVSSQAIELAIIPGLAFDRKNRRLGRGGGHYDRLLSKIDVHKIGVCFDMQVFEAIPDEEHDVAMDEVVCDGECS